MAAFAIRATLSRRWRRARTVSCWAACWRDWPRVRGKQSSTRDAASRCIAAWVPSAPWWPARRIAIARSRGRATSSCPKASKDGCRTRDRWRRSFISWLAVCGPAWVIAARGTLRNYARAAGLSWSARRRCRRAILMTLPLRRKRPITVREPSKAARTACSLLALLLAGVVRAQQPAPAAPDFPFSPPPAQPTALSAPQGMANLTALQRPAQRPPRPGVPIGGVGGPEQGLDPEAPAPYTIELVPPSITRVAISVESDARLQERIRQENRERRTPERITFPADPILSNETYQGRKWYPMKLEVAPYYVCHGRLYFQQINFERYGWDLGVLTPLVSGLDFLYDFVTLPYHLAVEPCRHIEYNTGWCLPGDP